MKLDAEHLQQMIADALVHVADRVHTRRFADFLEKSMSWGASGTRLSWQEFPHTRLDLTAADRVERFARTRVASHALVLVMFEPDEPGLICSSTSVIDNLDSIYWGAPGMRYFCGAAGSVVDLRPVFEDLAEYDGLHSLVART